MEEFYKSEDASYICSMADVRLVLGDGQGHGLSSKKTSCTSRAVRRSSLPLTATDVVFCQKGLKARGQWSVRKNHQNSENRWRGGSWAMGLWCWPYYQWQRRFSWIEMTNISGLALSSWNDLKCLAFLEALRWPCRTSLGFCRWMWACVFYVEACGVRHVGLGWWGC